MTAHAAATGIVVVLLASGCGDVPEEHQAAAPGASRAEPPLPGAPYAGEEQTPDSLIKKASARRLLSITVAGRRLSLIVARPRDPNGDLCVREQLLALDEHGVETGGIGAYYVCDEKVLPRPIRFRLAFGGARARQVDWVAIVGLARPEVERLFLQLPSEERELELRRWPGFRPSAFTFEGQLAEGDEAILVAVGEAGRQIGRFDAGRLVRSACAHSPQPECGRDERGRDGPWADFGDPDEPSEEALLNPSERSARDLFAADERAQELLGGRPWHAGETGEWYTCESDQGGVVLEVELEERIAVPNFAWPVLDDDCDGEPYRERTVCHSAVNVDGFQVRVDLERQRVVEMVPTGIELLVDGARSPGYFQDLPSGC